MKPSNNTDFTALDSAILFRIQTLADQNEKPTFARIKSVNVFNLAQDIANTTGRDVDKVVDGRLQSMRKAEKLAFDSKLGWQVIAKVP